MRHYRATPRLECLEDRTVPATIRLVGGDMFLSNWTSPTLNLTATGTNTFTVTDNTLAVNVTVGGRIFITGTNKADTIEINMDGNIFTGDIFIDSRNGNDTVDIFNGGAGDAAILGNILFLTGKGNDTALFNTNGAANLRFGGRIQGIDLFGDDTVTLGGAAADTLFLGEVRVLGYNDVNVGVAMGGTERFGGNLDINILRDGKALDVFVEADVTMDRDVNIRGNILADTVNLLGPNTIGRNLNINLGGGGDTIIVSDIGMFTGAPITVNGNFTLDMGEGDNFYDLDNPFDVFGNMTIRAGQGNNDVSNFNGNVAGNVFVQYGNGFNAFFIATAGQVIGGNVYVTAGNGDNFVGVADATIAGDFVIRVGNGLNVLTVNDAAVVGGTVRIRTGNGDNSVSFTTEAAPLKVDVVLGNGDDNVSIFGAMNPLQITGRIDGGGGENTYFEFNVEYLPIFVLANFP